MIDKNELLFVVDEQNEPQKSLPRYVVHRNGIWHRTTGIWVINERKQILCQKRSIKKDKKPEFWEAFFGGHLHPQDSYIDNAIEELSEELGINALKKHLIPYKILKSDKPTHKEFQHIFIYILNKNADALTFEKEEIDEIKWFDLINIEKILIINKEINWVQKWWDEEVLEYIKNLDLRGF